MNDEGPSLDQTAAGRGLWSSRLTFVLAATGSAVGLGNIWKFPYITGENGGGAFVLVYLICIASIGLPLLIAEVMIGRRGGSSPTDSITRVAVADGRSPQWRWVGTLGTCSAFLILTFYSIIGGWSLAYLWHALNGNFSGSDPGQIGQMFAELLAAPWTLIGWHTAFMLLAIGVVAAGIRRGIERAVSIIMPALFLLLLALAGYALTTDGFQASASFMFSPDFEQLSGAAVLEALGHAFFTLSLGMSIMLAYGSHLRADISIPRTALSVVVLDTLVSLLAGIAIFSIVFSNDMDAGQGPGLIFQTIPLAFNAMPGGSALAVAFFVLLLFAAWTSAISLLEPPAESLETRWGFSRRRAVWLLGACAWLIGIACALSFNLLDDVRPIGGMILFDLLDFVTANIMLPLVGLLIALFTGWAMRRSSCAEEFGAGTSFRLWYFLIRYITPALVLMVFLYKLS